MSEEELEMDLTAEDWKSAEDYLMSMLEAYIGVGPAGLFGAILMKRLIRRLQAGERTRELYDEIMALE